MPALAFELAVRPPPPHTTAAAASPVEAGRAAAVAAAPASNMATVKPPPMGFNTWNRWHCWVDELQLKRTADLLVSLGLAAAGYTFLNVDE